MTEQKEKLTRKMKRSLITVAVVVVAAAGCFFAGMMWRGSSQSYTSVSADLISQRLDSIGELATVEYFYTNAGRYENQADFYGWKVPFTKKSFFVCYDGSIKAGIDVQEIGIDVKGKTITITLPPAEILSHEIDRESIEVLDETKNIFNQISITEYNDFCTDQMNETEQQAREKGLLEEAQQRAKNVVLDVLETAGIDQEQWEITFVQEEKEQA